MIRNWTVDESVQINEAYIPGHLYRSLITDGSGSGKSNC